MDGCINFCGNKTGFVRPGYIYYQIVITEGRVNTIQKTKTEYYIELPVSKKLIEKIKACVPVSFKYYIVKAKKYKKLIITVDSECNY